MRRRLTVVLDWRSAITFAALSSGGPRMVGTNTTFRLRTVILFLEEFSATLREREREREAVNR